MMTATFNELFRWFTALNFAGSAAPQFAFFEEEDVQKELADRDEVLTRQGVRFMAEYYQRAYNLEENDFVVGEPTNIGRIGQIGPIEQGQFAENQAQDRLSQGAIDQLSKDVAESQGDAISTLLAPILDKIQGANDYSEIAERIYEAYPDLDTTAFERLMTRALFVADLWGYVRAKKNA
jgi:hypothetical protein